MLLHKLVKKNYLCTSVTCLYSAVTREWHEKKDAEGKTYYYQIYTKEKTYEQPDMWLPLDKQDSPAMRWVVSRVHC